MKKRYLLFLFAAILLATPGKMFAQIVGTDCFLQGQWLEIGMQGNGSFGTNSSPTGYHPHFGPELAEVYDYGHDGWTIGTPPYMGDYTYPGSPFEGWEMQLNGLRSQAFQAYGTGYSGSVLAGSVTAYNHIPGRVTGTWNGTATSGTQKLQMRQETRVDTNASWVVVTTFFYNTTGTDATGVYYMRSCDPDNDETWSGGAFSTSNVVNYQIPSIDNRVEVTATGNSATHPPLSLATKDCRAVAFIYNSWSLSSGVDLATVWGKTYSPASYTVGAADNGDIAIGLVYNLGTIYKLGSTVGPDSAAISYAYVFNGPNGIDSAFPDPELAINNVPITRYPDTLNACAFPGVDSLPVDILYGNDKDWTWGSWTWSPAVGLSSTTGVKNYIHLDAVPGYVTYTVTGNDSNANMLDCNHKVFVFTVHSCHIAWNNGPCYGDTLQLRMGGDSLHATYMWRGPLGFTSTLQNPFRFPAVWTDTGLYHCYKTIGAIIDTDSTYVVIHPRPIVTVTDNGPLCAAMVDTLLLTASPSAPGETFSWIGPNGYVATGANPTRPGFGTTPGDPGVYQVIATTSFGCKDTTSVVVSLIPQPGKPIISDRPYCQGQPFVPYTVADSPHATIIWYPSYTGGVGTTTAPTINTSVPGYYTVYASQKIGSCESNRDSLRTKVTATPLAPVVTGTLQYCQYIGPIVPLHVFSNTDPSDITYWYSTATGFDSVKTEPIPNINVAGTYNSWVNQIDSSCPSPRTPVTIVIHPKPNPPIITPQKYCQLRTPGQAIATVSEAGDVLTWYGPGVTAGSSVAPTPNTFIAPSQDTFYVKETSSFGCISDSSRDIIPIILKPAKPVTTNVMYCQGAPALPLNFAVDSFGANSYLNWYFRGAAFAPAPVPPTDTIPGNLTWYVSQTINGCESDSAAITSTIVYKPVFTVTSNSPKVCRYDTLTFSYDGPTMNQSGYLWSLPPGAKAVNGTNVYDSSIMVELDTANLFTHVVLKASDNNGFCSDTAGIIVDVVGLPAIDLYTKGDVCLGDTTQLALASIQGGASVYSWYVDGTPMGASNVINLIAASSNSGGPFLISWIDSGQHIITVTSKSDAECKSAPALDSVFVHMPPNALFQYSVIDPTKPLCLEDSVLFMANTNNYNYSYNWTPTHFFNNTNTPTIWGTVQETKSIITLTVTDPFGCASTASMELDPETCCTIGFPNAFAPGSTTNKVFRPISGGYHRFHTFRIVNRWGQTIYESSNNETAVWDGNYNGVPQDMGVYYYYLKYDCGGNTMEQKGDVTLIR